MININEIKILLDEVIGEMGTPSISVSMVEGGKIHYIGAGEKNIITKEAPDKDTIYAIGSATKAFTATAIAMLVDEGKLAFESPIKNYIPEFRMYNAEIEKNLTVADILCHRSGLPRHEFTWYLNSGTLKEMVEMLRYLEPSKTFRESFQYQNHMFMLAGYLVQRVSGCTWAEFIDKRILKPLGMLDTFCDENGYKLYNNKALPYFVHKTKAVEELEFRNIDEIGAAGSINSTASDMAKWIDFNINEGKVGTKSLVSEKNLKKCHSPQMVISGEFLSLFKEIELQSYGFGWFIESYKGVKVVQHGGSIDGFISSAAFIPSLKTGFTILTNHDNSSTATIIRNSLFDIILNSERLDWTTKVKGELEKAKKERDKMIEEMYSKVSGKSKLIRDINEYEGEYVHPAYGSYKIENEKGQLVIRKNDFVINLRHIIYDNFLFVIDEEKDLIVTCKFDYDKKGKINKMKVDFEESPIVFNKSESM